jgi:hypothetical protein
MVFKYTKNDKATGKGGKQQGQGVSTDSKDKTNEESSEEKK